jgi:hypothetical protein
MNDRRLLSATLVVLGFGILQGQDFDQNLSPNMTHQRERAAVIPTIYGDLRRDFGDIAPGYPLPRWTPHLDLDYRSWNVVRRPNSPIASRPGNLSSQEDLEQRDDLTLTWRQTWGWSWVGTEVIAKGSRTETRIDGDEFHWGDLITRFTFPLSTSRYQSWQLVIGAQQPIGDKTDWEISHGFWTFEAGVRGSVGMGFFVLGVDLLAGYNPFGENTVENTQPEDVEHALMLGDGGISLSYRPLTWMRTGITQRVKYRSWQFEDTDVWKSSDHMLSLPTSGVLEFTPFRSWHVSGEVGYDWVIRDYGFATRDRLSFAATITTNF